MRASGLGKLLSVPPRFLWVVAREYYNDEGLSRASSLAYTTLLSLIPVAVVIISFAAAFEAWIPEHEEVTSWLETTLLWKSEPMVEVTSVLPEGSEEAQGAGITPGRKLTQAALDSFREDHPGLTIEGEPAPSPPEMVADALTGFVDNIRASAGALGFIGIVVLIVTVISLFNSIESHFNSLWHVRATRDPVRKFLAQWTIITLGSVMLLLSQALTSRYLQPITDGIRPSLWAVLPFAANGLAFFVLYRLVPHTRVGTPGALVAGLAMGVLWQVFKGLFGWFVATFSESSITGVTYRSLAMVPIFLLFLYLSWVIILVGVKISFVWDHWRHFETRRRAPPGTAAQPERSEVQTALQVLMELVADSYAGRPGTRLGELARRMRLPQSILLGVIDRLREADLVRSTNGEDRFQPARPPDAITVYEACSALAGGTARVTDGAPPSARIVAGYLVREDAARRQALGSTTLRDLHRELQRAVSDGEPD